jgi:hypothetical protein
VRMFGGKIGIGELLVILVLYSIFCGFLLAMCWLLWRAFSNKPFPWKKFILAFAGLFVVVAIASLLGC